MGSASRAIGNDLVCLEKSGGWKKIFSRFIVWLGSGEAAIWDIFFRLEESRRLKAEASFYSAGKILGSSIELL